MKPIVKYTVGDDTPCTPGCIELDCECGDTLHIRRIDDLGGWYAQHGENPEARSRTYSSYEMFLRGTREWRDSLHKHQRR